MKLIDAILNVERPESESPWDFSTPINKIAANLGIEGFHDEPDELSARLKSYPVLNWYCTDTHVGLFAMYLDGEAVGCHYRNARKSDYEIEWISLELAEKTKAVIMSYINNEIDVTLIDQNQDIGDDYGVSYVSQALTSDGLYEGRPVKALIWYDSYGYNTPVKYRIKGRAYIMRVPSDDPKSNCVKIQDGKDQRIIPIKDFRMPFKLARPTEQ